MGELIYHEQAYPEFLKSRRITVFGYGAQGRAQARNLSDAGYDVVVGLRDGSSHRAQAEQDAVAVASLEEAAQREVLVVLIPDHAHAQLITEIVNLHAPPGAALIFAHGFSVHYQMVEPRDDLDVVMAAPFAIGEQVRKVFTQGGGVPGLVAVAEDRSGDARKIALAYADAIGCGRAGIIETRFDEETETDLFAEQAVLCGGLTHLVAAAFDTLVEAGYQPEIAYFCCLHEVNLIAEMMQQRGIDGMRESISSIAEFGDRTRGPRIVDEHVRGVLKEILAEIRDGRFAAEWQSEAQQGFPAIEHAKSISEQALIEITGAKLRALMPWLKQKD